MLLWGNELNQSCIVFTKVSLLICFDCRDINFYFLFSVLFA